VALVAENNPLPADYPRVADLDPAAAAGWYLHTERHRSSYATQLAERLAHRHTGRGHPHVVCDKGALATLAYAYAATTVGLHPTLYPQVRDLRRSRPGDDPGWRVAEALRLDHREPRG
jgi:hypothetical protein